jgi:L-aspartate oxidase
MLHVCYITLMSQVIQYDVLIIGSGAAGQSLALQLAPHHRIALLSKGALTEGCTAYAQGGIAAATDPDDTHALHA